MTRPCNTTDPAEVLPSILALVELSFKFSRTIRITYHEDRVTRESDTDHTVMLALVACAFAERCAPWLDLGLVSRFADIHDLIEAECGDTNTLAMGEAGKVDKARREAKALEVIRERFAALPYIATTIDRYESLADPEARFVKVLDKALPRLTHALNGGVALREQDIDLATVSDINWKQEIEIGTTYGADQSEAMQLLVAAHRELAARFEAKPATAAPLPCSPSPAAP